MTGRLVVSGLGVVGPFGIGAAALARTLEAGEPLFDEVDRGEGFHLAGSARRGGRVDPAGLRDWLDLRSARRMSLPSKLAVAAARNALADAGLAPDALASRPGAVVLGTAFGPTAFSMRILDQVLGPGGPESVSPFLFMESVANVHAGQVALDHGLTGPNATVTQREAGTLQAVAQAGAYVASGAAPFALCGGVEEIAPMTHAVLDRFHALSRGASGEERGRAFDRDRDGFVASEGAVVLLLEPEEFAARREGRGATPRAVLRAAIRANDPSATPQGWGTGDEALARALSAGLERAGVAPHTVDRVVSGASGSRAGDRLEAAVLRRVLGDALPPVLAPKATCGEFGAGLLGAALLAVGGGTPWPTPGFEAVDPACGVRPHDGRALDPARRVLVSALASGGAACWLVLDAPTGAEVER